MAAEVWSRFGDVGNFVEPFLGSGAVLLARPRFTGNETVNDKDGFVSNFFRALKHAPEETAEWGDNPVNENDLHARHLWLVQQREELRAQLEGSPDYFCPKIAGWWVWGISCWIGSGFCSGDGPWSADAEGRLVLGESANSVQRKLPHLGNNGRGVNRQLPHLGNNGQGVNRQLPHLGNNGQGVRLLPWFAALSARLARVRVCSGDWSRVCGPSVTFKHGLTGVFLDPPYADTADRMEGLYREDCGQVAHAVREWAIEAGKRDDMRVALCGYAGEHEMPESWSVHEWNAGAGFGGQAEEQSGNGRRERVWFSPACLGEAQPRLL